MRTPAPLRPYRTFSLLVYNQWRLPRIAAVAVTPTACRTACTQGLGLPWLTQTDAGLCRRCNKCSIMPAPPIPVPPPGDPLLPRHLRGARGGGRPGQVGAGGWCLKGMIGACGWREHEGQVGAGGCILSVGVADSRGHRGLCWGRERKESRWERREPVRRY